MKRSASFVKAALHSTSDKLIIVRTAAPATSTASLLLLLLLVLPHSWQHCAELSTPQHTATQHTHPNTQHSLQVIKIGTSSLINEHYGTLNLSSLSRICEVVRELHAKGEARASSAGTRQPGGDGGCGFSCSPRLTVTHPTHHRAPHHHRQQRRRGRGLPAPGADQPPQQARAEAGAGGHRPGVYWCVRVWSVPGVQCSSRRVNSTHNNLTHPSVPHSPLTLCRTQVHLMRYYEDIMSALGLVGVAWVLVFAVCVVSAVL
jgi:hypothetical protein